jgi:hypothetical protein
MSLQRTDNVKRIVALTFFAGFLHVLSGATIPDNLISQATAHGKIDATENRDLCGSSFQWLKKLVSDRRCSVAMAAESAGNSTLEELEAVLLNEQNVSYRKRNETKAILRQKIMDRPEILDEINANIIVGHPDLFNENLLNKLFDELRGYHKDRAASRAITTIAANTTDRRLVKNLVTKIAAAFDNDDATYWAACIVSKIASARPELINGVLIDKLFSRLADENSRIISAAALIDIVLNTEDDRMKKNVLSRVFHALDDKDTAWPAGYILFHVAEAKPDLIKADGIDQLFTVLKNEAAAFSGFDSLSLIASLSDRKLALNISGTLSVIASDTDDDVVAEDIILRALGALGVKGTERSAAYILFGIAKRNPDRIDLHAVDRLFAILKDKEPAFYASEALAALASNTKDKTVADNIISRTMAVLDDKDSAWKAANIISGVVKSRSIKISSRDIDKLLPLLSDRDHSLYASDALSDLALYATDEALAESITATVINSLSRKETEPPGVDKKKPSVRTAAIILKIAKKKPHLLQPHIGELLHKLENRSIRDEICYSLYYAFLSGDQKTIDRISVFIGESLSAKKLQPIRHDALLYFAQIISYELDRLHYFDNTNSRMREIIDLMPDSLLYIVLAQGVEGYIVTFKEIHRNFKQNVFNQKYEVDDQADNDKLWEQFAELDPKSRFLGDILYAYAAKGHLRYIIPEKTDIREDMVDESIDLIKEIHNPGEIKNKGMLMAETITYFLHNMKTKKYTKKRLLTVYKENRDNIPQKVMFESLIFKNKDILEEELGQKEKQEIIYSGNYIDYRLIPGDLNKKSQKMFIYFSDSQKGYLTRMIDYYMGHRELYMGDKAMRHPHMKTVNGFTIDKARSTPGIVDGRTADRAMGEADRIRIVLTKTLIQSNTVEYVISNDMNALHEAADDMSYTAYGFAGHSGENWVFREIVGTKVGDRDRYVWIFDGSCGSARHATDVVKNRKMFLFSNLETGKGPINQIQTYYIAHYLAEGLFREWQQLRKQMRDEHTGYTRRMYYPGNPADNVLKNFIFNMERLRHQTERGNRVNP